MLLNEKKEHLLNLALLINMLSNALELKKGPTLLFYFPQDSTDIRNLF